VYFGDTEAVIAGKIAEASAEKYVYAAEDTYGQIFNPLVEKAIFAVESARAMQKTPFTIAGVTVGCGQDVVDSILTGLLSVADVRAALPGLVYQYVIRPFGAKS
jgi:hypothetical protein